MEEQPTEMSFATEPIESVEQTNNFELNQPQNSELSENLFQTETAAEGIHLDENLGEMKQPQEEQLQPEQQEPRIAAQNEQNLIDSAQADQIEQQEQITEPAEPDKQIDSNPIINYEHLEEHKQVESELIELNEPNEQNIQPEVVEQVEAKEDAPIESEPQQPVENIEPAPAITEQLEAQTEEQAPPQEQIENEQHVETTAEIAQTEVVAEAPIAQEQPIQQNEAEAEAQIAPNVQIEEKASEEPTFSEEATTNVNIVSSSSFVNDADMNDLSRSEDIQKSLNEMVENMIETVESNNLKHDDEANFLDASSVNNNSALNATPTEIKTELNDADSENSAVAAVVAAVEQAVAAKAAAGESNGLNGSTVTPKSAKKKAKSSNRSANTSTISNHLNNSSLNNEDTSPSSSQKRRKKDPSAPKAPLNGYLVYFNEERADMRSKNPGMSFGELTKIIAAKWKELPTEEKQKYINEAEIDKERYVKEMADYKKSDSYRQYIKENTQAKMARHSDDSQIFDPMLNSSLNGMKTNPQEPNLNWLQQEANIAGFDVPVFTEEFIEHSKNREHEMRQLRKEINELEQQNSVLHKHIDSLKQTTTKIDSDIDRFKNSNGLLQKNIDLFRQTILHCFNNIPLPNTQDYPTPQNIDDYIMRIYSIVNSTNQNESMNDPSFNLNRQFANHVKTVFSNINFSSLFEAV
jgi:hypothetical protein